jgi:hypothetical protein
MPWSHRAVTARDHFLVMVDRPSLRLVPDEFAGDISRVRLKGISTGPSPVDNRP